MTKPAGEYLALVDWPGLGRNMSAVAWRTDSNLYTKYIQPLQSETDVFKKVLVDFVEKRLAGYL